MKRPEALDLLIVRHGESEGNRDRRFTGHGPSPLTDLGRRQADAVGHILAAPPPDAIYVSDLPRTVATAAPLVARTGILPVLTERLRERAVGTYTGMTFAEVEATDPAGWAALVARDPGHCPPGGESHHDCADRVGAFLDELVTWHPAGRVVLVSHGVAIHHMLRHLLGLRHAAVHVHFQVDNCAVQRVERRAGGAVRVFAINDTSHLVALM